MPNLVSKRGFRPLPQINKPVLSYHAKHPDPAWLHGKLVIDATTAQLLTLLNTNVLHNTLSCI